MPILGSMLWSTLSSITSYIHEFQTKVNHRAWDAHYECVWLDQIFNAMMLYGTHLVGSRVSVMIENEIKLVSKKRVVWIVVVGFLCSYALAMAFWGWFSDSEDLLAGIFCLIIFIPLYPGGLFFSANQWLDGGFSLFSITMGWLIYAALLVTGLRFRSPKAHRIWLLILIIILMINIPGCIVNQAYLDNLDVGGGL